jgi:hypothetical protein
MPPAPTQPPLPPELPPDAPNAALLDYYDHLKSIFAGEGLGSITKTDLDVFYGLMQNPNYFTRENLEKIFGLLEQLASAEAFEDMEVARETVRRIEFYKEELGW